MRFVPYHKLDNTPNIIVDGAAGPGTILTLSHWPKSGTPPHFKRDTSAEIAFAYLDSPALHVSADIVSNNHFDEDGLIGIYALVDSRNAQLHRDLLTDTASAGDFGVFKQRDAARMAFTISAYADADTSPLPQELFALPHPQMSGDLYKRLLELIPDFVSNLAAYRQYWESEDERLTAAENLIERGMLTIEEKPQLDLAIVRVGEGLPPGTVHRFTQKRSATWHPFAVHSRTQRSRLLVIAGEDVEFHYRYESWVQLASRKPLARVDLTNLALDLNQKETSGGRWVFDGVDRITPRLHLEGTSSSSLPPEVIQTELERHLAAGAPAWDPYDKAP